MRLEVRSPAGSLSDTKQRNKGPERTQWQQEWGGHWGLEAPGYRRGLDGDQEDGVTMGSFIGTGKTGQGQAGEEGTRKRKYWLLGADLGALHELFHLDSHRPSEKGAVTIAFSS